MFPFRLMIPLLATGLFPALAQGATVAVVATGDDAVTTGRVQWAVEQQLASVTDVELLPTQVIATSALAESGRPPWPQLDPALESESQRLFDEVKKAYYLGDLKDALVRLRDVEERVASAPASASGLRARVELWRTAINLGAGRKNAALLAAREALRIRPALKVDLSVFSPQVEALVNDARNELTLVTASFQGLPEGGQIRINFGPPATADEAPLPRGEHLLSARAPGYRYVEQKSTIEDGSTVDIHLPIALKDSTDRVVRAAFRRGTVTAEARRRFAQVLDADLLVLVLDEGGTTATNSRAMVVALRQDAPVVVSPTLPASPQGQAELASWVGVQARRLVLPGASEGGARGWHVAVTGSVLVAQLTRNVDWEGCGPNCIDSLKLPGQGVDITLNAAQGQLLLMVEAMFLRHPGPLEVTNVFPDAPECASGGCSVDGPTSIGGRAGVAYRLRTVHSESVDTEITLGLGAVYLKHNARDVVDQLGPIHALPTYQHVAPEVRTTGELHVHGLTLGGQIAVAPIGAWTESPVGTTGVSVTRALAWEARLKATIRSGHWQLGVGAGTRTHQASFSGTATTRLDPAPNNATLRDVTQSVMVLFTRSF